jgi:hypothetical protein
MTMDVKAEVRKGGREWTECPPHWHAGIRTEFPREYQHAQHGRTEIIPLPDGSLLKLTGVENG